MVQGNYRVVLTGNILEGFEHQQVVAAAAKLFKCSEVHAKGFLQGKPTALKREMDAAIAGRYQQQLSKYGIASRLEPINPTKPSLELVADPEPSASSGQTGSSLSLELTDIIAGKKTAHAGFQCPKCGTPQEKGEECVKCGIIFSRYDAVAASQEVDPSSDEEAYDLDEMDELALFVGENFDQYRFKFAQLHRNEGQYQTQWHWPAFLAPIPWLIYRKLYAWAAALLVIQLILPPIAAMALGFSMGLMGNYLYYRHATQRIAKIDATGDERRDEIIASGGTNSLLVTIGATIVAGILVIIIYSLFFMPPEVKKAMKNHAEAQQEMDHVGNSKTKKKMLILKNFLVMHKRTQAAMLEQPKMPRDLQEMREMFGTKPIMTKDEWGTQMDMELDGDGDGVTFYSAGQDKVFDTDDDVVLETKI